MAQGIQIEKELEGNESVKIKNIRIKNKKYIEFRFDEKVKKYFINNREGESPGDEEFPPSFTTTVRFVPKYLNIINRKEILFIYIRMGVIRMSSDVWYPTENDVINAVVSKLKSMNFKIISTCSTKEHGVDIVSKKEQNTLLIEAKGGTSSMKESNNYGKPFNRNQIRTHISVAIFAAMNLISEYKDNEKVIIGIALPYEKNHKEFIEKLKYVLNKLEIIIFWVKYKEVLIEFTSENMEKIFKNNSIDYNDKELIGCPKCNSYNEARIWDEHTKEVEAYSDENFGSVCLPIKRHIEQKLIFRCPKCNKEVFGINLLRKQ